MCHWFRTCSFTSFKILNLSAYLCSATLDSKQIVNWDLLIKGQWITNFEIEEEQLNNMIISEKVSLSFLCFYVHFVAITGKSIKNNNNNTDNSNTTIHNINMLSKVPKCCTSNQFSDDWQTFCWNRTFSKNDCVMKNCSIRSSSNKRCEERLNFSKGNFVERIFSNGSLSGLIVKCLNDLDIFEWKRQLNVLYLGVIQIIICDTLFAPSPLVWHFFDHWN